MLNGPVINLLARFAGERGEAKATDFLNCICPNEFAANVNAAVLLLQRKTHGPVLFYWRHRVEAQAAVGNIQNDATVVRLNVDVCKFVEFGTGDVAAFSCGHDTPLRRI